jgi:hypothetical protein
VTRRSLPAALVAFAVLVLSPAASAAGLRGAAMVPGVILPGAASAAAVAADPATWIVAARGDRAAGDRLARAYGGRRIAGGAWEVSVGRARPFAADLRARGLLDYAEPNRIARPAQAPDPLSVSARWRDFVVKGAVAPPVGPASPLIALVDTIIDPAQPEIAGSNIATLGGTRLSDFHGTATATVAAAPANGVGMLGVWPGARALNVPLPNGQRILCSDSARAIARAVRNGAAVINMSYGSPARCVAEAQQITRAVNAGAIPVAASGNELADGNPLEFPASLPHVLTVAAIGPNDRPTSFSNTSAAIDLSAPGIGILAGVPAGFDPDGTADGFAAVSGTSFSAPMVSAAAAWIRAARPDLTPYQVAQVVRRGARDVGAAGYDKATGFGVLDLPGALAARPPADDPLEPNEDVRDVNGRAFGALAPPLYNGGEPKTIAATADLAEDPLDVYRVKVRAGHRLRATLTPASGDPDLFVYGSRARSVFKAAPIARSSRRRGADRVTVRNRGARTTTFYVAVAFTRRKDLKQLDASYTLRAG